MNRKFAFFLFAFILVSAVAVFAADVTGAWSGTTKGPDGNDVTLSVNLKQDGMTLTGTVTGPQGEPIPISDGKIDGDKLSFNVMVNGMAIVHEGVMKGNDEMALTAKFPQGSGIPDMQMDMKRAK
jgi:hypothetical protein